MNAAMWEYDDEPEPVATSSRAMPVLVSLQFILAALRRRRSTLVLAALAGLLLGVLFAALVPAERTADATVALAHDPTVNADAMATDVSIATTRAVANATIQRLGLDETPTELLQTVTATATTSDILTLTLKAGTDAEAVRRLSAYTREFLTFRAQQLSSQSELVQAGTNRRIDALDEQAKDLTARIDKLSDKGQNGSNTMNDLISRRAQLDGQVGTLQQAVQDSAVRTSSIVAASRIIDPAAAEPAGGLRRLVLIVLSAIIGCTALGAGLIILPALLSDRLHRRVEVATALEVPVGTSVGQVESIHPLLAWLPGLRGTNARRAADLQRLARAIQSAVPKPEQGQWLAVGCVDNAEDVALGVVVAADELQRTGHVVRLVDLTDQGLVKIAVEAVLGSGSEIRLPIYRPRMAPSLARDASDIVTYGPDTREIPALGAADVFLTVADLDPAVGAFHLSSWTNRVVVAVTAGLSSAERVRTAAELVRSAGLELHSALVIGTEPSDVSFGNPLTLDRPDFPLGG